MRLQFVWVWAWVVFLNGINNATECSGHLGIFPCYFNSCFPACHLLLSISPDFYPEITGGSFGQKTRQMDIVNNIFKVNSVHRQHPSRLYLVFFYKTKKQKKNTLSILNLQDLALNTEPHRQSGKCNLLCSYRGRVILSSATMDWLFCLFSCRWTRNIAQQERFV